LGAKLEEARATAKGFEAGKALAPCPPNHRGSEHRRGVIGARHARPEEQPKDRSVGVVYPVGTVAISGAVAPPMVGDAQLGRGENLAILDDEAHLAAVHAG
jgi:hypothetical protein